MLRNTACIVQIVTDEKYEFCKTGFNVNHVICALHEKPHEECELVAAFFCTSLVRQRTQPKHRIQEEE